MENVYSVILAGGLGMRLWPVSSHSLPKPFATFIDDRSLFQKTVERIHGMSPHSLLIVANRQHENVIDQQLEAPYRDYNLILEPCCRNTAPAVAISLLHLYHKDPKAFVIFTPCDHWVESDEAWKESIKNALRFLSDKKGIVSLCVRSTHDNDAYGLIITPSIALNHDQTLFKCSKFVEKPSLEKAKQLRESEEMCWWNTGVVIGRVEDLVDAYKTHAPMILSSAQETLDESIVHDTKIYLSESLYTKMPSTAYEYVIAEKIKHMYVGSLSCAWADFGTFSSIYQALSQGQGPGYNVGLGQSLFNNCEGCISISKDKSITMVGLKNMAVVSWGKNVLALPLDKNDQLRSIAPQLQQPNDDNYRPWGHHKVIDEKKGFCVKRIDVIPNARLSLQQHQHRQEIWTIAEGTAEVTIDNEVRIYQTGDTISIPKKALHRIKNIGSSTLIIIEVQLGEILNEADIIRLEDDYGRMHWTSLGTPFNVLDKDSIRVDDHHIPSSGFAADKNLEREAP